MASASSEPQMRCDFVVLALLLDESLASAALNRLGVTPVALLSDRYSRRVLDDAAAHCQSDAETLTDESFAERQMSVHPDDPLEFIQVLDRAAFLARRDPNAGGISSAHLLMAVFDTNEILRARLTNCGVDRVRIATELDLPDSESHPTLPIDFELTWTASEDVTESGHNGLPQSDNQQQQTGWHGMEIQAAWRIVDANLNRSREGLRVLEDYARFALNDGGLSGKLKNLRHQLVAAERLLPPSSRQVGNSGADDLRNEELLRHRDTEHDVGTQLSTSAENIRNEISDVVTANSRRVQEALRSLEEFGKLFSADFAGEVKQIRYRSYTLQMELNRTVQIADVADVFQARRQKLLVACVYVLITESTCRHPWQRVVEAALRGGADVLQLREKQLSDRELMHRARWITDACRNAGCLSIINDRADVAVAANADGVHVGQEELTAQEARAILRPEQLLGVSTHTLKQAQAAQSDGADYIGVGPTFPTATKSFSEFSGLTFVTEVNRCIQLPAFAIGGIGLGNLNSVRQAGANRVAVTSCVAISEDPEMTVRELKRRLTERVAR